MSKVMFKNLTFLGGFAWLMYGAMNYGVSDWDVGVASLLAAYTYFSAEWTAGVFLDKKYKLFIPAILAVLGVEFLYMFYWTVQDKANVMIDAQFIPSICLYLLVGISWKVYQKPRELIAAILQAKAGSSLR